jgi:hypothetical protein
MVADRSSRMEGSPGESGRHRRWILWEQRNDTTAKNTYKKQLQIGQYQEEQPRKTTTKRINYKQKSETTTLNTPCGGPHDIGAIRVNPAFSAESVSNAIWILGRRGAGCRPLRDQWES